MTKEEYSQLQENTEEFKNSQNQQLAFEAAALNKQLARKTQEAFFLETECLKKDSEIELLKTNIKDLKKEISGLKSEKVDKELKEILESNEQVPANCS